MNATALINVTEDNRFQLASQTPNTKTGIRQRKIIDSISQQTIKKGKSGMVCKAIGPGDRFGVSKMISCHYKRSH